MPYYCTVPRCTSMAGKAKNVSFHQFPRDEELARLWNKILKRGKPYTKYSKVCSLHFRPEDYTVTSVGKNKGQWRTLRKDAIPSQNLPSESPVPSRRNSVGWGPAVSGELPSTTVQQQVAQAIYVQTMLAMQVATNGTLPAQSNSNKTDHSGHTSKISISDLEQILKQAPKSLDPEFTDRSTSYKCMECSKCFKDPDVFVLHRRTHIKHEKLSENISLEKENYINNDRQETLRANPILANLLKADVPNSNIFDTNNVLSIENQIMTALTANMESYLRNLTSILQQNALEQDNDESHANDMSEESPMAEENSLIECQNSTNGRRDSMNECQNSIEDEENSMQDCHNSTNERRNSMLDCQNSIDEQYSTLERQNSTPECQNSTPECQNSTPERQNSTLECQNSNEDDFHVSKIDDCPKNYGFPEFDSENERNKSLIQDSLESSCDNKDLSDSKDSINLVIDENA